MLLLRNIHRTKKKALVVLPFVALCEEKEAHLARLLQPLSLEVRPTALLLLRQAVDGAEQCTRRTVHGQRRRLVVQGGVRGQGPLRH